MAIHTEDLEYHRPAGSAPLLARYYRPEGRGPFPGVLEVHGGAWTSGDRLNNVAIGEYLAAHGIVVLSIDFRMPPAARYPDTVADVNFGIRFLKANAQRFATRRGLVGGLGTSSGGHLLLLNALRPHDARYAAAPLPGSDASLAFAVACWPVADPLARYRAVIERGNDRLAEAHHQFWPSEEAMAEGSPQLICPACLTLSSVAPACAAAPKPSTKPAAASAPNQRLIVIPYSLPADREPDY